MSDALEVLRSARSVLVVDWPSQDVPESLVRAGYEVVVKSGPGPADFTVRSLRDGEVVARPVDTPPDRVDVLYAHRPLAELPGLAAMAQQLGARALWWQTGLSGPDTKDPTGCWASEEDARQARSIAESHGLVLIAGQYIADAVRDLGGAGRPLR